MKGNAHISLKNTYSWLYPHHSGTNELKNMCDHRCTYSVPYKIRACFDYSLCFDGWVCIFLEFVWFIYPLFHRIASLARWWSIRHGHEVCEFKSFSAYVKFIKQNTFVNIINFPNMKHIMPHPSIFGIDPKAVPTWVKHFWVCVTSI